MYTVERVPLPPCRAGRRTNPITAQIRKLAVGESFVVPHGDPNWTGNQVRNERKKNGPRYVTVREEGGLRIGRVE